MPHRPSGKPSGGGKNVRWSARWMTPKSTKPFARDWRRNRRRNRSRDGCSKRFRPPRFAANDLHLDQAGRGPRALGSVSAASRKASKPAEKAATTADAARIENRPDVIEERLRLGDFEGDTVPRVPPGTGGLATVVDRKSRFTIITKVQSKNADHVHKRIKQRMKELDEERRHFLITFDNGTDFARCHRLDKHLGMELYFADPGCPYQRGTNENTNGLIRQYFPEGRTFATSPIARCDRWKHY